MRRQLLTTIAATTLLLGIGTAVASAEDSRDKRDDQRSGNGQQDAEVSFKLEIDVELDARFSGRQVSAVQAAVIVAADFPGAQVTEAELDERDGGPIWEIKFNLDGSEREVDVDADDGAVLGSD